MILRPDLHVGSRVWHKIHTVPFTVVGETCRSWLVRYDGQQAWEPAAKLPKTNPSSDWLFVEQEWIDRRWALAHAWCVSEQVRRATDTQLRQIAAIIEYDEEKHGPRKYKS